MPAHPPQVLIGHEAGITSLSWSLSNASLLSTSNDGAEAMTWGWSGVWRRWRRITSECPGGTAGEEQEEVGAISGHSGAVKCLDWSPKGDYLVSVGLDPTTSEIGVHKDDSEASLSLSALEIYTHVAAEHG
ncbi:hypothetical protein CY34DRAFT_19481 [Suillus luteus UH-Slu-Lm8-n1]|uniref:Elongator complex protein 2 n=1 Tax=Suillus luteus UH-Slu-Lm8-n1 TaxID=930992 RepID=A0A0C9ZRC9_9AGAM|nr:hypothetical protein CY34DRAFT_19481 [Suillus luteus UH-Slu-Lm8-n1]